MVSFNFSIYDYRYVAGGICAVTALIMTSLITWEKNTKTALIGGLSIIFYIILLVVISTKFIVKM